MKKCGLLFAVLFGCFMSAAPAGASSFGQGWSQDNFSFSVWGEENGNQVWLNASVSSPLHRLDSVHAEFFHPDWADDAVWQATFSFGGLKNNVLNNSGLSHSTDMTIGGVEFHQFTDLSYWDGEGGPPPQNRGYASISVSPSRLDWSNSGYNEWWDDYYGKTRWYAYSTFRGDFGAGAGGEALGRAFFGTPEPATLALLAFGGLAFGRRRRSR